jgi:hypothetical protein
MGKPFGRRDNTIRKSAHSIVRRYMCGGPNAANIESVSTSALHHAGEGAKLIYANMRFCPQCERRRSSFCRCDEVNREAQIATVLIVGSAAAFVGWAIVYLASAPTQPYKGRRTGLRRLLSSAAHRLFKARE